MKKTLLILLFFPLFTKVICGQEHSPFNVNYMVSFDAEKKMYTAWVVPDYDTPNRHNADTEEKGATAQFTLKVPKGFVLNRLKDIRGIWDKYPVKLGSEAVFANAGLSSECEYYIVGKAPAETNYGTFRQGEPVALFSFTGNLSSDLVQPLEPNDPFIRIADTKLALNVGNSFYSRSGQRPSLSAKPLEQFYMSTQWQNVIAALNRNLSLNNDKEEGGEEVQLLVYPNPVKNQLIVRFFSTSEGVAVHIDLVDAVGAVRQNDSVKTKTGLNTVYIQTGALPNGAYVIHTRMNKEVISKKIVKAD